MLTEEQTSPEGASPLQHKPLFNAKRDTAIVKAGGFWCHACLISHPAEEQSPDPRYCQGCYEVLLKEAEMLAGHVGKTTWIPENRPRDCHQNATTRAVMSRKATGRLSPIPGYGGGIMSTQEDGENKLD